MRYALLIALPVLMTAIYAIPANAQTSGLVSCWSLDESSGVRADSYGVNHLTDINTVGVSTGKIGQSASFVSANSERLYVGLNSPVTSYTYAYWILYTPDNIIQDILPLYTGAYRMYTYLYPGNADATYMLSNSYEGWLVQNLFYTEARYGEWVFVAASFDADSGETILVIDNLVFLDTLSAPDTNVLVYVTIGTRLNGLMDEVSVWNTSKKASEIGELYNHGVGVSCADIVYKNGDAPRYTIDTVPLPSGKSGAILYNITAGDVGIVTLLSILITLLIYWIIREQVKGAGVHNDVNK